MHILTKLLVVLTSVLAVLLAGLTIAYSANADALVAETRNAKAQVQAEKARADSAAEIIAANQEAENLLQSRLDTEETVRETRIRSFEQRIAELEAENQRLRLNEQRQTDQINSFIAMGQQADAFRASDREEIAALRTEINRVSTRLIDLIDRNSDLESLLEASDNQVRAQQEIIVELRRGGDGTGGVAAALPSTFRARVSDIVTDSAGAVLIEINAGSSDRLAEDMELNIVRGGLFLGKIRLVRVDLNEAVGRLILDGGNGSVRDNDEIRPAA